MLAELAAFCRRSSTLTSLVSLLTVFDQKPLHLVPRIAAHEDHDRHHDQTENGDAADEVIVVGGVDQVGRDAGGRCQRRTVEVDHVSRDERRKNFGNGLTSCTGVCSSAVNILSLRTKTSGKRRKKRRRKTKRDVWKEESSQVMPVILSCKLMAFGPFSPQDSGQCCPRSSIRAVHTEAVMLGARGAHPSRCFTRAVYIKLGGQKNSTKENHLGQKSWAIDLQSALHRRMTADESFCCNLGAGSPGIDRQAVIALSINHHSTSQKAETPGEPPLEQMADHQAFLTHSLSMMDLLGASPIPLSKFRVIAGYRRSTSWTAFDRLSACCMEAPSSTSQPCQVVGGSHAVSLENSGHLISICRCC